MPYGWKICSVSDIAYLRTGATFDKANVLLSNKNEGIRVLRGGNISTCKIDFQIDDIFIPTAIVNPSIHVQQYDIITPAVTSLENIGKMARVFTKPTSNYTVGGFVYLLTPLFYNDTFSKFLLYQFTSTWFIRQLQAIAKKSGAAFYNINKTKFNGLPVFIPPLEEQARIVKRIEELFEQIEIIEQNQADIDTLYEEFRKRTLTLAIQGKLVPQDPNDEPACVLLERIRAKKKAKLGKKFVDSYIYKGDDNCYYEHITGRAQDELVEIPFDIPDNWTWAKLLDLGGFSSGKTPDMSEPIYWQNGNVQWFTSKDMKTKYLTESQLKITELAAGDMTLYPANTLLWVVRSGILKSSLPICILKQPATINQDIKAYQLYQSDMIDYVYYMLKGMEAIILDNYVKRITTVHSLKFDELISKLAIPIPPLAEQKRIVAKINEIFAMQ